MEYFTQFFRRLQKLPPVWQTGRYYIYGAGRAGHLIADTLRKNGAEPVAFIDRRAEYIVSADLPVRKLEDSDMDCSLPVIIGIFNPQREADHAEIAAGLYARGFRNVIPFLKFYSVHSRQIGPYVNLETSDFYLCHQEEIVAADRVWTDEKSRTLYRERLAAMALGEVAESHPIDWEEQYWPQDVPLKDDMADFADLGAFDGDTIAMLLEKGVKLRRIWGFEPDLENYRKLVGRVLELRRRFPVDFTLVPLAVGNENGSVSFSSCGNVSSCIGGGKDVVTVCRLDDMLHCGFAGYIKMDIEGAEWDALCGMRRLIEAGNSALAVCIYHKPVDIFQIPLLLKSWNCRANLYLRNHCANYFDSVCYMLPAI